MQTPMTRRERLEAIFIGAPVDRTAVALWRHFPGDDQRPADLAAATLMWQATWDWDFIKVSPASSFCLVDWGAEDRWLGGDEGNRQYTGRVVVLARDWARLPLQDPTQGALGGQIDCLNRLQASVGADVPFLQTIFSPLAQAKNLAGAERLVVHLRQSPDLVHAGLEVITRTTLRFIEVAKAAGIAGIYYAVQLANFDLLSEAEYRAFGEPYDRRIIAAVSDCWFNMVHLHGRNGMFDLVAGYPVHALNWHDRESGPALGEGAQRFGGAVCGGLEHWDHLLRGDPDQIHSLVRDAIDQTGGRRLIVSSGCVRCANQWRAALRERPGLPHRSLLLLPALRRATCRRPEVRTAPTFLSLLRLHPFHRSEGGCRGAGNRWSPCASGAPSGNPAYRLLGPARGLYGRR
jgi:uroporphyrinogen decarboxylase